MSSAKKRKINRIKAIKDIPTAILLKKKAECDAKALKIVERLIEPQVDTDWILNNLGQINRAHMEDVIEERAIIKFCGYVLCNNPLSKIVNKKYQISTLRNKVYDVEKVKNFCSYFCYTAAEYIINQMMTSPLWLRCEEEIPEITILPKKRTRTKSPPGVEVNIVGIELPIDDDKVKEKNSSDNETGVELNSQTVKNISDDNKEMETNIVDEINEEIKSLSVNEGIHLSYFDNEPEEMKSNPISEQNHTAPKVDNVSHAVNEIQSDNDKVSKETSKIRTKRKSETKPIPHEILITRIEKCFTEWITRDTINLLHGEEVLKQKLIDQVTRQEKYTVLCNKLNQLQLQEENERPIQRDDLKPSPHYSVLEEHAKNLEVKVRAFYNGKTDIGSSVPKSDNTSNDCEAETYVPLTDGHAPQALRRRIFLDKLNKVLPDLLRTLAGPSVQYNYTSETNSTVKTLVSTFALSATNIVFKTAEWTLVTLLIIKVLGLIDPVIKSLLSTKQATMYMSMIFMTYKIDTNYLDCLINSVTSIPSKNDKNDEDV